MGLKTLVLDVAGADFEPATGTRIRWKFDRDVATTGGGVVPGNRTLNTVTVPDDGTFPQILVYPSDDPILQSWSRGYSIIITAEPTSNSSSVGGYWMISVTSSDPDTVLLSSRGPASPLPAGVLSFDQFFDEFQATKSQASSAVTTANSAAATANSATTTANNAMAIAQATIAPTDTQVSTLATTAGTATQTALDGRYPARYAGTSTKAAPVARINVRDYGAVGDGSTDDTAALQAAINAAGSARALLELPWTGNAYMASSLSTSSGFLGIRGTHHGSTRFGVGSNTTSAVTIRQIAGSAGGLFSFSGGGVSLENINFDGNNRANTATLVQITYGMELRMSHVRISQGGGVGLEVQGANNVDWQDIFVDNCGSNDGAGNSTAPSVRMRTVVSDGSRSINMAATRQLNIEYSQGVSLELGLSSNGNYPEFVIFDNLHVECPTSYGGGIANPWPMVQCVNGRSFVFTNPYLYGGPGLLLTHEATVTGGGYGGLLILGGTLLGLNGANQPATLIRLITGDQFASIGTRFDSYSTQAVLIDSTYGPTAYIEAPLTRVGAGAVVTDNRTTINSRTFNVPVRVNSPAVLPNAQSTPKGVYVGQNTSSAPVIGLASGTTQWQVTLNTGNSHLDFNISGVRNALSLDTLGNLQLVGGLQGLRYNAVARNANYTATSTDSLILCTAGGITITLPSAASIGGRAIIVRNVSTGSVTVASASTVASAWATISAGSEHVYYSDGAKWW